MLTQLAIRNILSYKKRSLVTLILTAVSTALLVFSTAFMDGSHSTMIRNAVEVYPNYIQITHKEYRDNPGINNLIESTAPIRRYLDTLEAIKIYGERFETFVLLAAREKSVGALFTGVEPARERHLSQLAQSLVEGRFLTDKSMEPELYIGKPLARKLHLQVGDEVSFIGTGADYSFTADNLRVVGTFVTGLYEFDTSSAFVSKRYFDSVMSSDQMATHIVILPQNDTESLELAKTINEHLDENYESLGWQQFMSGLLQAMKLDSIFGYVTLGIIFIVIFFVIMIYTLLSVFSRIRELGVLRAIGTTPGQIATLLVTESALLSLAGILLGGLLGGIAAYYFQVNPIMPSGYEEQFKQYGLVQSAIPAVFSPMLILRDMLIMYVLAMGSTIYPILRVLGYHPVEAMQHV